MAATGTGFWQRARRLLPWTRLDEAEPDRPVRLPAAFAGLTFGGYPVERSLAHGAMGDLFLSRDPASGQPLALKTVRLGTDPLARSRFLAEAASASRLRHPAIVATHASGVQGAVAWIAMEWVPGHDLSRHTEPAHLLPWRQVLDLMLQVADGLDHAHARGVLHRDLKPSNVLVQWDAPQAKIADFGCARLDEAARSRSGLMLGTPMYLAPEQVTGAPLDARTDLHALALMTWQLLTGRSPCDAAQLSGLLQQIVHRPVEPLAAVRPELPPSLSAVLARALSKDPDQRQDGPLAWSREVRAAIAAPSPTPVAVGSGMPRQND